MAVAELDLQQTKSRAEESQLAVVWRRFRRHKLGLFGLFTIIVLILLSVGAPWLTPYERDGIDLAAANMAPGRIHWLGADELGQDILTRLLYAGRISLVVGFSAMLLSEFLGVLIGSVAGYFSGMIDAVAMRVVDFMLTIPLLPILLIMSAILNQGGLVIGIPGFIINIFSKAMILDYQSAEQALYLILILALFSWMGSARLIRGVILSLREQEFTEAARALGVSDFNIIMRHMIPNALAPIIVNATLAVGSFIVLEAALSFLGFGIRPPTPTWGNMLSNVQLDMWLYPWKALYPGFFIFMTSLSFNFIGDALRDALDPRQRL